MNEERAWYLLSLQLSGEATAQELEELNALLQQHADLGLRVEIMRNIWRSKQQPVTGNNTNFDKHLQRLSHHLAEPVLQFDQEPVDMESTIIDFHRPVRRYQWLWIAGGIAASLLIVFLLFLPGEKNATKPQAASNTISTRPGSKSKVELPDGTQVWLNADSKITYHQNFLGAVREVELTGEAYFDVVKDKTRPFIIHTSTIDVKVLGTAFNVRSYPDEKTTETALIRGSVEITLHNSPDKRIILKPNEKLVVKNDIATVLGSDSNDNSARENEPMMILSKIKLYKKDSSSHYETMWVKNRLAFENEAFERMVGEIERWYNVQIIVKNESLNALHFTGDFENKSLGEVMEALSISTKFHYEIKGGQVIIW